jgi:hypothetical protein
MRNIYDDDFVFGGAIPPRSAGPSKAELQRMLQDAVRNTGGTAPGVAPASAPPVQPLSQPKRQTDDERREARRVYMRDYMRRRYHLEKKPTTAPRAPKESPSAAPTGICERCGGPRSFYSVKLCRACYQNKRREGPALPSELSRARCENFVFIKRVNLVRAMEYLHAQLSQGPREGLPRRRREP